MPKSDHTKYASEIPMLHAWDPTIQNSEVAQAQAIAFKTHKAEYDSNVKKTQKHKQIIMADMIERGYSPVTKVKWQANDNRNDNGSPADIIFEGHVVGGTSVKDGSDIIGNFGTRDFDINISRPKGEDLFGFLAPAQFNSLLLKVKKDLMEKLNIGETWTKDREDGYGKYSLTRISETRFTIKSNKTSKTLSYDEIISEQYFNKKNVAKKLAGSYRRVFGDYYQDHKKEYKKERDDLYSVLYPKICELFKSVILSDDLKLSRLGGFTEQPYYVSDLKRDKVYFVQGRDDVKSKLVVDIFNKEKEKTFGSGFELGCNIKLEGSEEGATLDFYVCYNAGTFNRGPVIKVQNFSNKENLWTSVY